MPLILVFLLAALGAAAQTSVLTYHNDNARTGQYLSEVLLTPANVKAGQFGRRAIFVTDGAVFAQPLYLSRVKIAGKGLRNVVFVATSHDSLYAFDADDNSSSTPEPLWQVNFLDADHGVTTVTGADVQCGVIPELGITGTPVIDPVHGTIYLIAATKEPDRPTIFRLHAINVTNGAERSGSPVEIDPPGFVPVAHKHRTGLLLSNGVIYSSWSGHCDLGTYHGWVMTHDALTLKLTGVFNDTSGGSGASFWNGGAGPSEDAEGNVYVVAANGYYTDNLAASRYDETVLKFGPAPGLPVVDTFTPFNQHQLDDLDLDLGSSGALILPDETGSAAHPHLLFTSGKEGRMYLLDRQHLGGPQLGSDSGALASLSVLSHPTFGMATYFNGSIYIAPEESPMLAFPIANATLASKPSARASNRIGNHGATPSISANGDKNGVVWVTAVEGGGKLLAYDASNLKLLYDSNAQPEDSLQNYSEFSVPTIADGKVFVPFPYGVAVFGELASDPPAIGAVTNAASYATDAIAPGSLISIFGSGLAPLTGGAQSVPLPLSLADVSVTVNGLVAPVLFVSPQQINAQVPFAVPAGPAKVVVRVKGAASSPAAISVARTAPGIFTNEQGQAAARNADGSANSADHPAPAGTFVSLFFTGQGALSTAVDDGGSPAGNAISAKAAASATIGSVPAFVQFAGLAPNFPGVGQINLRIPPLASGTYPVIINIGGAASNVAQLVISAH